MLNTLHRELRHEATVLVAYALLYQENRVIVDSRPHVGLLLVEALHLAQSMGPTTTHGEVEGAYQRLIVKGYLKETDDKRVAETKTGVIHFNLITGNTNISPDTRVGLVFEQLRKLLDAGMSVQTTLSPFAERMRARRQRKK